MTDEQQLRALLTRAAELPDDVRAPVTRLVETARRLRRLRALGSVLAAAAVTCALFVLPPTLQALFPTGGEGHSADSAGAPVPTAAQLSRFRWSALPASPLGQRSDALLAWTGKDLLELGGTRNGVNQWDGAAFDVARRRWRRIAKVPSSVGLDGAVSVWTGQGSHQLFVTNNVPPSYWIAGTGAPAGLYDPVTNRWTVTDLPSQMLGLQLAAPVWTGHDVLLAGTSGSATGPRLAVAAYNVETRSWRMITPHLPRGHPTGAVAMVATWHKVILWSLWSRSVRTNQGGAIYSGVDVLVLRHGQWTAMTGHWPQHRIIEGATFADFRILIPPGQYWCGSCPAPFSESPARFADAGSLALTTIPDSPLVTQPLFQPPIWLWNGKTVLAANIDNAGNGPVGRLGRLAAYDPLSRRWYVLPRAPGRPALGAGPIFADHQVMVLGLDGALLSLGKGP